MIIIIIIIILEYSRFLWKRKQISHLRIEKKKQYWKKRKPKTFSWNLLVKKEYLSKQNINVYRMQQNHNFWETDIDKFYHTIIIILTIYIIIYIIVAYSENNVRFQNNLLFLNWLIWRILIG